MSTLDASDLLLGATPPDSPEASPPLIGEALEASQILLGSEEIAIDAPSSIGASLACPIDLQPESNAQDGTATDPTAAAQTADAPPLHEDHGSPPGGEPHVELPPATYATGHYTRSPERSPAEDLSRLTGDGLIDYLEQLGVEPPSIQIILNTCQDGLE